MDGLHLFFAFFLLYTGLVLSFNKTFTQGGLGATREEHIHFIDHHPLLGVFYADIVPRKATVRRSMAPRRE